MIDQSTGLGGSLQNPPKIQNQRPYQLLPVVSINQAGDDGTGTGTFGDCQHPDNQMRDAENQSDGANSERARQRQQYDQEAREGSVTQSQGARSHCGTRDAQGSDCAGGDRGSDATQGGERSGSRPRHLVLGDDRDVPRPASLLSPQIATSKNETAAKSTTPKLAVQGHSGGNFMWATSPSVAESAANGVRAPPAETLLLSPTQGQVQSRDASQQMSLAASLADPMASLDENIQEMMKTDNKLVMQLQKYHPDGDYLSQARIDAMKKEIPHYQFWSVGAANRVVGTNLLPFPAHKVQKEGTGRGRRFANCSLAQVPEPSRCTRPVGQSHSSTRNEGNAGIRGTQDIQTSEQINRKRVLNLSRNLNVKQLTTLNLTSNLTSLKTVHNAMIPGQALQAAQGGTRLNHMFKKRRNTALQPLPAKAKQSTKTTTDSHSQQPINTRLRVIKRASKYEQQQQDQDKKTINLAVSVAQDHRTIDQQTEQRSNFEKSTQRLGQLHTISPNQMDRANLGSPLGLTGYELRSPGMTDLASFHNEYGQGAMDLLSPGQTAGGGNEVYAPLATQHMMGMSPRFDQAIPKLHLKAISAERKRSDKDNTTLSDFKLKLSKLDSGAGSNPPKDQASGSDATQAQGGESPRLNSNTPKLGVAGLAISGAKGKPSEEFSNQSIRDSNKWNQLQMNDISSSLALGETHLRLDAANDRHDSSSYKKFQPSASRTKASTHLDGAPTGIYPGRLGGHDGKTILKASSPSPRSTALANKQKSRDGGEQIASANYAVSQEIEAKVDDYKAQVPPQQIFSRLTGRDESRFSQIQQWQQSQLSKRQAADQCSIKNGFKRFKSPTNSNVQESSQYSQSQNEYQQPTPPNQSAQQWNQNNAFLKDKKLSETSRGAPSYQVEDVQAVRAQQFEVPIVNSIIVNSLQTAQTSKPDTNAMSGNFHQQSSKDTVRHARNPPSQAVQSNQIDIANPNQPQLRYPPKTLFDDCSSQRDYNLDAGRNPHHPLTILNSTSRMSQRSQKSTIKIPKVNVELVKKVNDSCAHSETKSPSASPTSPRSMIDNVISNQQTLVLHINRMERRKSDLSKPILAQRAAGPRQQFGALKPHIFPINHQFQDQKLESKNEKVQPVQEVAADQYIPMNMLIPTQGPVRLPDKKERKEVKCGKSNLERQPSSIDEQIDYLRLQEHIQTSIDHVVEQESRSVPKAPPRRWPSPRAHDGQGACMKQWAENIINRCSLLGPLSSHFAPQLKVKQYNLPLGVLPQDHQYIEALQKICHNLQIDPEVAKEDQLERSPRDPPGKMRKDEEGGFAIFGSARGKAKHQQIDRDRTGGHQAADITRMAFKLPQNSEIGGQVSTRSPRSPVTPQGRPDTRNMDESHPETAGSALRGWHPQSVRSATRGGKHIQPPESRQSDRSYAFNPAGDKTSQCNMGTKLDREYRALSNRSKLTKSVLSRSPRRTVPADKAEGARNAGVQEGLPHDTDSIIQGAQDLQAVVITDQEVPEEAEENENEIISLIKSQKQNQPRVSAIVQQLVTGQKISAQQQYRQRQTIAGASKAARRLILQQAIRQESCSVPKGKPATGSLIPLRNAFQGQDSSQYSKRSQRNHTMMNSSRGGQSTRAGQSINSNQMQYFSNGSNMTTQLPITMANGVFQPLLMDPGQPQPNLFTNEAIKYMEKDEEHRRPEKLPVTYREFMADGKLLGTVSYPYNSNQVRGMTPAPACTFQRQMNTTNTQQTPFIPNRMSYSQTPNINTNRTKDPAGKSTSRMFRNVRNRGKLQPNMMPETCSVKIQMRDSSQKTYVIKGQKQSDSRAYKPNYDMYSLGVNSIKPSFQQSIMINSQINSQRSQNKDLIMDSQESITQKFLREAQHLVALTEQLKSNILIQAGSKGQQDQMSLQHIEGIATDQQKHGAVQPSHTLGNSRAASSGQTSRIAADPPNAVNAQEKTPVWNSSISKKVHNGSKNIQQQIDLGLKHQGSKELKIDHQVLHARHPYAVPQPAETQTKIIIDNNQFHQITDDEEVSNKSFNQTQLINDSPFPHVRGGAEIKGVRVGSQLNNTSSRSHLSKSRTSQQQPGNKQKLQYQRKMKANNAADKTVQGVSIGVVETDFDDLPLGDGGVPAAPKGYFGRANEATDPPQGQFDYDGWGSKPSVENDEIAASDAAKVLQPSPLKGQPIQLYQSSQADSGQAFENDFQDHDPQEQPLSVSAGPCYLAITNTQSVPTPKSVTGRERPLINLNKVSPELVARKTSEQDLRSASKSKNSSNPPPRPDTSTERENLLTEALPDGDGPVPHWPASTAHRSPKSPESKSDVAPPPMQKVQVPKLELSQLTKRNESARKSIRLNRDRRQGSSEEETGGLPQQESARGQEHDSQNWRSHADWLEDGIQENMVVYSQIPANFSIFEFDRQFWPNVTNTKDTRQDANKMKKHQGFWQQMQSSSRQGQDTDGPHNPQVPRTPKDLQNYLRKYQAETTLDAKGVMIDGTTHHFLPRHINMISSPEQIQQAKSLIEQMKKPTSKSTMSKDSKDELFQNTIMKTQIKMYSKLNPQQKKINEDALIKVQGVKIRQNERGYSPYYKVPQKQNGQIVVIGNQEKVILSEQESLMKERFPEPGAQKQGSASESLRKSIIKNTASRKQSAGQAEEHTNQGSQEMLIHDDQCQAKVEAGGQIALPKIPDSLQQPLIELIQAQAGDNGDLQCILVVDPQHPAPLGPVSLDLNSIESQPAANVENAPTNPSPDRMDGEDEGEPVERSEATIPVNEGPAPTSPGVDKLVHITEDEEQLDGSKDINFELEGIKC